MAECCSVRLLLDRVFEDAKEKELLLENESVGLLAVVSKEKLCVLDLSILTRC